MKKKLKPESVIFLKGVKGAHLDKILKFIYGTSVSVSKHQLKPILEVAKSLQVKGLQDVSSGEIISRQSIVSAGRFKADSPMISPLLTTASPPMAPSGMMAQASSRLTSPSSSANLFKSPAAVGPGGRRLRMHSATGGSTSSHSPIAAAKFNVSNGGLAQQAKQPVGSDSEEEDDKKSDDDDDARSTSSVGTRTRKKRGRPSKKDKKEKGNGGDPYEFEDEGEKEKEEKGEPSKKSLRYQDDKKKEEEEKVQYIPCYKLIHLPTISDPHSIEITNHLTISEIWQRKSAARS